MKKILILEDNKKTAMMLQKVISEINQKIQIFIAEDYDTACKIALEHRIDVFILDIVLSSTVPGDISGIKFAECIRKFEYYMFTPIIFITGLIDNKFYTFQRLHSFAYLEKPFSLDEAKSLVQNALMYAAPVEQDKSLYFRKDGVLYAVNLQSILYVVGTHHSLEIYMEHEEFEIPYYTLKQFLKEADNECFIQCSRNTIINKRFIKHIDISNKYLQLKPVGQTIEIGSSFVKKVMEDLL